jgi:hypothetical protein
MLALLFFCIFLNTKICVMSTAVAEAEKTSYVKTRGGEVPVEISPEAFEDATAHIGVEFSLGEPVTNNAHQGHICGVAYADIGPKTLPYYCFRREYDGHVSIISRKGSRYLKKVLSQAS